MEITDVYNQLLGQSKTEIVEFGTNGVIVERDYSQENTFICRGGSHRYPPPDTKIYADSSGPLQGEAAHEDGMMIRVH